MCFINFLLEKVKYNFDYSFRFIKPVFLQAVFDVCGLSSEVVENFPAENNDHVKSDTAQMSSSIPRERKYRSCYIKLRMAVKTVTLTMLKIRTEKV